MQDLLQRALKLLTSSDHEIANLLDKLRKGEQEGWEGSMRRTMLRKNIENLKTEIKAELNKGIDGDGI